MLPKHFVFLLLVLSVSSVSGDSIPQSLRGSHGGLQVELTSSAVGTQAVLVNRGERKAWVGKCEIEGDGPAVEQMVGDVIQRWDAERNKWVTVIERRQCRLLPVGPVHVRFSRVPLEPGESLPTDAYARTEHDPAVHRGDLLRFIVLTETSGDAGSAIASPAFTAR